MSIILDVILVAIVVVFIVLAAKKGFALTLLELVASILAIIVAYQLSPVISQGIYDVAVEKSIVSAIEEYIDDSEETLTFDEQADAVFDALPEFAVSFAETAGIDLEEIKEEVSEIEVDTDELANELTEKVAEPIVVGAMNVIIFVLLAFILMIVLKIVANIVSKAFEIPLVKTANTSLGAALGAVKGVLFIVVLCTALKLLFSNGDSEFSDAVNDSFVIGLLDYVNPLINSLINKF